MDTSNAYIAQALFVWEGPSKGYIDAMLQNPYGTKVSAIEFDDFIKAPDNHLKENIHVVVSGSTPVYGAMQKLAIQHNFSMAYLPLNNQQRLIKHLGLSYELKKNIHTALQNQLRSIDVVSCNGHPMFFDADLGRIPFSKWFKRKRGPIGFFTALISELRQFRKTNLIPVEIKTASGRIIHTAASGIYLQHFSFSLISRVFADPNGVSDGRLSAVIVSPFSILEYIKFFIFLCLPFASKRGLPRIVGRIRSSKLMIKPQRELKVRIDEGHETRTPLNCEVLKDALNINAGKLFWKKNENTAAGPPEIVEIKGLPDQKEIPRYTQKHIPFFSHASESRFKDLFQVLREDARISQSYIILMVISTILATTGLLLNSASVVIGAMLLAPLMTPIVSFSMGLLRGDNHLLKHSALKLVLGIIIGLLSSMALTYIVPYFKLTGEINARINPTILDLGVAVISGIAAAYTKSFKEIYQSLAGVAVAVALVPPLAVSGIGICHGEYYIFFGAFLLFLTNLVGITLAATFTFQVLGYSPALEKKKSFLAIFLVLLAISYPLYLSFSQIRQNHLFSNALKQERYLVNGKYVIISNAKINSHGKVIVLNLDLTLRDKLTREDFQLLKNKIQTHFSKQLYIRANIKYIL